MCGGVSVWVSDLKCNTKNIKVPFFIIHYVPYIMYNLLPNGIHLCHLQKCFCFFFLWALNRWSVGVAVTHNFGPYVFVCLQVIWLRYISVQSWVKAAAACHFAAKALWFSVNIMHLFTCVHKAKFLTCSSNLAKSRKRLQITQVI